MSSLNEFGILQLIDENQRFLIHNPDGSNNPSQQESLDAIDKVCKKAKLEGLVPDDSDWEYIADIFDNQRIEIMDKIKSTANNPDELENFASCEDKILLKILGHNLETIRETARANHYVYLSSKRLVRIPKKRKIDEVAPTLPKRPRL